MKLCLQPCTNADTTSITLPWQQVHAAAVQGEWPMVWPALGDCCLLLLAQEESAVVALESPHRYEKAASPQGRLPEQVQPAAQDSPLPPDCDTGQESRLHGSCNAWRHDHHASDKCQPAPLQRPAGSLSAATSCRLPLQQPFDCTATAKSAILLPCRFPVTSMEKTDENPGTDGL